MGTDVTVSISMSLDGYVAGPNQSREHPLGEGGEQLHEWIYGLRSWRESHGMEGGETNADSEVVAELVSGTGASVMGRSMFGGEPGPWGDEPWEGWWGDDPPFHGPVFVLTHHAREPLVKEGGTTFTFVTDGIEAAIEQAKAAAGDRNVSLSGGGSAIQQGLAAGLVDTLQLDVVPILLGGGVRLLQHLGTEPPALAIDRVVSSPTVTHIRYRVGRP